MYVFITSVKDLLFKKKTGKEKEKRKSEMINVFKHVTEIFLILITLPLSVDVKYLKICLSV